MMKSPPWVSSSEEPLGVPEEESPGVEERCSGPPISPPSHPMKPPGAREERCDGC
jgi:hypothetical protein